MDSFAATRRRWTPARFRALLRARGPTSVRFRKRVAVLTGAIAVGIVATLFAQGADVAGGVFDGYAKAHRWLPLVTTPAGFMLLVWITRRFAPLARGSGIPQVIAARDDPETATRGLISMRTAGIKAVLTWAALLCGAKARRYSSPPR